MKIFPPRLYLIISILVLAPLSQAAPKTTPPPFDPKAQALWKKVCDHYRSLRSYSGLMRWTRGGDSLDSIEQLIAGGQTQVKAAGPKLFLVNRIDKGQFDQRYIDDGENTYVNVFPEDVLSFPRDFIGQDELWKFAHASDFGLKELLQKRNPLQPYGSYVVSIVFGPERKKGESHIVVQLKAPTARGQIDYFLGSQDLSLHSVRVHQVVDGKTLDNSEEHSNILFNPDIPASELEPDAEMKRLLEEGRAKQKPDPATPPTNTLTDNVAP
ncbi:hypothetical protein EON83_12255 [bacterium]|nr:MAG: hypothetical protein EON83_12255 [bacterium]